VDIVDWTREYCADISSKAKRGGGESTLDKASAACGFFLVNAELPNPFRERSVSNARKALKRITAEVGGGKKKSGT